MFVGVTIFLPPVLVGISALGATASTQALSSSVRLPTTMTPAQEGLRRDSTTRSIFPDSRRTVANTAAAGSASACRTSAPGKPSRSSSLRFSSSSPRCGSAGFQRLVANKGEGCTQRQGINDHRTHQALRLGATAPVARSRGARRRAVVLHPHQLRPRRSRVGGFARGEWVECMGVAIGCGEQEVGVASGSGWNLWVWL